jgi:hypothetical protein
MTTALKIAAIAGAAAAVSAVAALHMSARAETTSADRIVGYSVDAHTQYVLLQAPDGRLRSCMLMRQTALRTEPKWDCTTPARLP